MKYLNTIKIKIQDIIRFKRDFKNIDDEISTCLNAIEDVMNSNSDYDFEDAFDIVIKQNSNLQDISYKFDEDIVKKYMNLWILEHKRKNLISRIFNVIKQLPMRALRAVRGGLIKFIDINKQEVRFKQILVFKKVVQNDLNGAYEEIDSEEDEKVSKAEKIIVNLSTCKGRRYLPKLNFLSSLKFSFISIFKDRRVAVILSVINMIYILFKIEAFYIELIETVLKIILLVTVQLMIYGYVVIKDIKKIVKNDEAIYEYLWTNFKSKIELEKYYNYVIGIDVLEEDEEVDVAVDEHKEENKTSCTKKKINNALEDNWVLIQKELFQIKDEEIIIPKIAEVFEKTEVHVINHRKISLDKLILKRQEIVQYLGYEIYQFIPEYKGQITAVGVELVKEPLPSSYKIDIVSEPSKSSSIIVGMDDKGWVEWDLNNSLTAHGIVAGASGSGKSVLMYFLIHQMIKQDFMIILADPKIVSFEKYEKRGYKVVYDNEEIISTLEDLYNEMEYRNNLLAKNECEKIIEYNKKVPDDQMLPQIIMIIDEFATLSEDETEYKKIEYKYVQILRKGRSAGIHIVIGLQDPLAKSVGGGQARALLNFRIAGLLKSPSYSEFMLGNKDFRAVNITRAGIFYVNDASKNNCYKILTPFIDIDKGEANKLSKFHIS